MAAAGEFAKFGPKGTRIQDIVRAAGVNERMIYHHFGSKDGLYRAVMQDQRIRLGQAITPALDEAAAMEPYEGMRHALSGMYDALSATRQIAALLVHEALGDLPLAVPTEGLPFPKPLEELYVRGQAEGIFSPTVPFEVAYAIAISTLLAMVGFGSRFTEFVPAWRESRPGEIREHVVTQVLNGLTG